MKFAVFSQGQKRGKMWEEFSWKAKNWWMREIQLRDLQGGSTSSGWIDIFRVDRHLQAIQTRPSNIRKVLQEARTPKEEGQLAFSNRHSGKCYKQKDQSENWPHFRNNHDTPITRWWLKLSFNPFENYANVKLDHLFPPRIGVKIQKKNI